MTRVSVLLPVYNAQPFLSLTLASLLAQTHRDLRIIAIDDGSSDNSGDVLEAAAAQDRRLQVSRRENRGLIATLNEGLSLADTDLVARMDADDIAYPDRFAAQLLAFESDPKLGLLGTNFSTLFTPTRVAPAAHPILSGPGERAILGRFCTCLRHPTVMFRRSRLGEGALAYDPKYAHAEDFDLFRRLALSTVVAETPIPYLAYRVHAGSVSATRLQDMCLTHLQILEENLTAHYPTASGTGMERIVSEPDIDSVDAAAEMIRKLDALALHQPDNERAAFAVGTENTVHFLFALLCRSRNYSLADRFVRRADRGRSIRRRERAILATPAAHVGMTVSAWHVGLQRRLGSRLLAEVLPGHSEILRQADAIDRAAGQSWTQDAA